MPKRPEKPGEDADLPERVPVYQHVWKDLPEQVPVEDADLPERAPVYQHVWKSVAGRAAKGFTTSSTYMGVHWHKAARKWVR